MTTQKEPLYGKNPAELAAVCAELGMPRFAAKQVARWLYQRHVEEPSLMSDLSLKNRTLLAERFATVLSAPVRVSVSKDSDFGLPRDKFSYFLKIFRSG